MESSIRQERLQQARQIFKSEPNPYIGIHLRENNSQRYIKKQEIEEGKRGMTYFSWYIVRTILVLFFLVCFGFLTMANPAKSKAIQEMVANQIRNNAFVGEAYETYSNVNYGEMVKVLSAYAKNLTK